MWILLFACNAGKSIDMDEDGFSPPDDCNDADARVYPGAPERCDGQPNDCGSADESGLATFFGVDGTAENLEEESSISTDGTVKVCGEVALHLQITGGTLLVEGTGDAVLNGGENGTILDVAASGVSLQVRNLEMIGGKNCFGSAIRAAIVPDCVETDAQMVAATIALHDVWVHDNFYDQGGGAIGISEGSTLLIDNTRLTHNEGHGIYAMEADVVCQAGADSLGGSWGNEKYGIWLDVREGIDRHTISSAGCDFGTDAEVNNNGFADIRLGFDTEYNFENDATFACDSLTLLCQ